MKNSSTSFWIIILFSGIVMFFFTNQGFAQNEKIKKENTIVDTSFIETIDNDELFIDPAREIKKNKHTEPLLINGQEVLLIPEVFPKFPGGEIALKKHIYENIDYSVMNYGNIQGKVYVRFVVTTTGEVANVEVVRGVDKILDDEAVRVVKTLPNFTPGTMNGKPVNVWYTVPVDFQPD